MTGLLIVLFLYHWLRNASTGCSRKTTQSLMHYKFAAVSHVLYTKVFRTYLVTQKKDTSKYSLFDNWQLVNYLKHQNRRHFRGKVTTEKKFATNICHRINESMLRLCRTTSNCH